MSYNDLCNYCSDLQRAQGLLADQYNGVVLQVDIHAIFRSIKRRKFDAEFYGIKYISVFEGVS
jgi:hypothetical protein